MRPDPPIPEEVLRVAKALEAVEFKMPGAGGLRGTLRVVGAQAIEMAQAAIAALKPE